jgi:hypothetical protein
VISSAEKMSGTTEELRTSSGQLATINLMVGIGASCVIGDVGCSIGEAGFKGETLLGRRSL